MGVAKKESLRLKKSWSVRGLCSIMSSTIMLSEMFIWNETESEESASSFPEVDKQQNGAKLRGLSNKTKGTY